MGCGQSSSVDKSRSTANSSNSNSGGSGQTQQQDDHHTAHQQPSSQSQRTAPPPPSQQQQAPPHRSPPPQPTTSRDGKGADSASPLPTITPPPQQHSADCSTEVSPTAAASSGKRASLQRVGSNEPIDDAATGAATTTTTTTTTTGGGGRRSRRSSSAERRNMTTSGSTIKNVKSEGHLSVATDGDDSGASTGSLTPLLQPGAENSARGSSAAVTASAAVAAGQQGHASNTVVRSSHMNGSNFSLMSNSERCEVEARSAAGGSDDEPSPPSAMRREQTQQPESAADGKQRISVTAEEVQSRSATQVTVDGDGDDKRRISVADWEPSGNNSSALHQNITLTTSTIAADDVNHAFFGPFSSTVTHIEHLNDAGGSGTNPLSQNSSLGKSRHRIVDFVAEGEHEKDTERAFGEWQRHSVAEISVTSMSSKRISRVGSIGVRRQKRRSLTASFMSTGRTEGGSQYVRFRSEPPKEEFIASVWRCHHVASLQDISLMRLLRIPALSVPAKPEFVQTAHLLSKLNHNGIQNVIEISTPELESSLSNYDFILVEDFVGPSLAEAETTMTMTCGDIIREVAKGLRYLHGNNVFHLHLTDRTVAYRPSSSGALNAVAVTDCATGCFFKRMTADFLYDSGFRDIALFPPELIREDIDTALTAARDLWALGALAYKLCIGEQPFGVDACPPGDKDAFFHAILSNPLTFPEGFDKHAINLISSLLNKEPSDRPGLATVLRDRFIREMGGESFVFSSSTAEPEDSNSRSVSHENLHSTVNSTTHRSSFTITPAHLSDREVAILDMTGELPEGLLQVEAELAMSERIVRKKSKKKLMTEAEVMTGEKGSIDEILDDCVENNDRELHLANLSLPAIPSRVFDSPFDCIVLLDLYNNELTDVPESIRFLVGLTSLILGKNKLTSLPESIGDLSELAFLDVNHNRLTDLPQSLMFADQLVTIAMDYNDVETIPTVIGDIPTLKTLYLAANPRLRKWPEERGMFDSHMNLQIGVDNEPNLVATAREYVTNPLVVILWNKVYPDMIVPGLYCGSLRSAQTPHVYEHLGIGYVLTAGRGLEVRVTDGMRHKVIIVDDVPGAVIDDTFEDAINFIREAKAANSGCLVHCFAGMSRSATTVIAYLMREHGMRLDEAYLTTKRGRPAIYPNHGFFEQLKKYDATLFPDGRPLDIASLHREIVP